MARELLHIPAVLSKAKQVPGKMAGLLAQVRLPTQMAQLLRVPGKLDSLLGREPSPATE